MTAVSPDSTDAASLLEDNYATLQSLLSVGDRETEVESVEKPMETEDSATVATVGVLVTGDQPNTN